MSILSVHDLQGITAYSNTIRIPSGHQMSFDGGLKIPVWTNSTRPSTTEIGLIGYNTETEVCELYSGSTAGWIVLGRGAALGTSSANPASSTQDFAAGTTSGTYWLTDGSNTFENYMLSEDGYIWARVLKFTSNHAGVTGTRDRNQFMQFGGTYNSGTMDQFPGTSRLTEINQGYWGHQNLYNFANNAGNTSFHVKVKGTNTNNSAVNKTFRVNNFNYSGLSSGTLGFDNPTNGLLDPTSGAPISGSLSHFTKVGDTNCRSNWGTTGISFSTSAHIGIALCAAGPNSNAGGGSGAFQFWHYNNYSNYINFSFSNDGQTQNYTYNALYTNFNCELYIRT